MDGNNAKKWVKNCLLLLGMLLGITIVGMIIIDPYFHYHKPFTKYRMYEARYINDGIAKYFDYDAAIVGTSMVQNFKTSEMNTLFDTNAVKIGLQGAAYEEIARNLEVGLQNNPDLKTVFWCVDYNAFIRPADYREYDNIPEFMYDKNPFNDGAYLLNKEIIVHGAFVNLVYTILGKDSTTFDDYNSWEYETGLEHILWSYDRDELVREDVDSLSQEDAQLVRENISINIVDLINEYPDTTFYIFYPPYSICYWDNKYIRNNMKRQIEAEQIVTELLLACPNVRLYNFFDQHDVIENLDYYNDTCHYSAEVNSKILHWIKEDVGRVTLDNYKERLEKQYQYYKNFDYESIYAAD